MIKTLFVISPQGAESAGHSPSSRGARTSLARHIRHAIVAFIKSARDVTSSSAVDEKINQGQRRFFSLAEFFFSTKQMKNDSMTRSEY